jgi:hypothetical protein
MAYLWLMDKDAWAVLPLDGDAFAVVGGRVRRVSDLSSLMDEGSALGFRRQSDASGSLWTMMAGREARVSVNGVPVGLGLAVLNDRDELRLPGHPPLFFSTEVLARVEPFPESGLSGLCPRCKQPIACGSAAVRCPCCSLWYHESDSERLPCWTYAPQCAACSQATALDSRFRWTPEGL